MARAVETDVVDMDEAVQSREAPERDHSEKPGNRRTSRWILLAFFAVAIAGASMWWLHSQNYENTDDAEIEGHLDLVSARISGTVTYINPRVEDTHFVEAGTLLLELDPRDYAAHAGRVTRPARSRPRQSRGGLAGPGRQIRRPRR